MLKLIPLVFAFAVHLLLLPQDQAVQPPLIQAILMKNVPTVKALLSKGGDPNCREILTSKLSISEGVKGGIVTKGRTALDIAVDLRSAELVRVLLSAKADPNARSPYDWTPLISASQRDNLEIVKLLLKHGAKPNLRNVHGNTAIIFAANVDRVEIVEALIKGGADLNGGTGETALIIAAQRGSEKSVKLLLEKGADPNFRRTGYQTALEYALQGYDDDVTNMIRKAGGKGRTLEQLRKDGEARSKKWDSQFEAEKKARVEKYQRFAKLGPEDQELLEAAMVDLATYKGEDFELSWEKKNKGLVLLDESSGNANDYTESQMNSELDERKANDISREMRRDLLRRNAQRVSLASLKFKDRRILLKSSTEIPDRYGSDLDDLNARGWISILLPGYSTDSSRAVLRFHFGPTPHGAGGTYLMVRKGGKWVVRWRAFAHYF